MGNPPPADNSRRIKRYLKKAPQLVGSAMSAYGYYSAEVKTAFIPAKIVNGTARPASIQVSITRNLPVRISRLSITIDGEAKNDREFRATVDGLPLAIGEIFLSDEYEDSKSALISTAQNLGYFNFKFARNQVQVSRKHNSASIILQATSGKRFKFGDINFPQSSFTHDFLQRWVPFKKGDAYRSSLIGELNQNLQNSGYFASVRVKPLLGPSYVDEVPVSIDLTQKKRNQLAIGVGFVTDTGFRTRLTWGKPMINRRGHSAEASLELSRDLQKAGFSYRIPRRKQPVHNYWGLEYGVKNEILVESGSFLSTLNFQRVSRTSSNWDEALFLRWQREHFETGGDTQTVDLIMPGISYSRNRSQGVPFLTWGQSVSVQLMGGSERALSSIDFLKISTRFRYLKAVTPRNTFITSLQYGAITSNELDRVPVSQRFFAGGDQSIRGFGFRQIAPTNDEGNAIGGRFLEVASLEYNYRFLDRWSGALFVDAGRAFNSYKTPFSAGAGVGIRWQSPVGPFRLDIAAPISDNDEGGLRVHLSLGPEL